MILACGGGGGSVCVTARVCASLREARCVTACYMRISVTKVANYAFSA